MTVKYTDSKYGMLFCDASQKAVVEAPMGHVIGYINKTYMLTFSATNVGGFSV